MDNPWVRIGTSGAEEAVSRIKDREPRTTRRVNDAPWFAVI